MINRYFEKIKLYEHRKLTIASFIVNSVVLSLTVLFAILLKYLVNNNGFSLYEYGGGALKCVIAILVIVFLNQIIIGTVLFFPSDSVLFLNRKFGLITASILSLIAFLICLFLVIFLSFYFIKETFRYGEVLLYIPFIYVPGPCVSLSYLTKKQK